MNIDRQATLDDYAHLLDLVTKKVTVTQIADDIYKLVPFHKPYQNAKVALVACAHGDEVVGLSLFIEFLISLIEERTTLEGELILVLANRPAYLINRRYVDVDLNRVYGQTNNSTLENRRAPIIRDALNDCDYILDIHQCIEPTPFPFFIVPFSDTIYSWVRSLAPQIPVIVRRSITEITTLSSYGLLTDKMIVTVELGDVGADPYQLLTGQKLIESLLMWSWQPSIRNKTANHLRPLAPAYEVTYEQPYSQGDVAFIDGLAHFDRVRAGQVLAYVDGEPIHSPRTGWVLMYPRKWFEKERGLKAEGLFYLMEDFSLDK
jgi:succinylglutamate desuccinylase